MKKQSWKGIPQDAQTRKSVRMLMEMNHKTPRQAYGLFLANAAHVAARNIAAQAQEAKRQAGEKAAKRREARRDIEESVRALAIVRDTLEWMREGNDSGFFTPQDVAMLAHSQMAVTGRKLEKALLMLGVMKGSEGGDWFE